MSQENVEIAKRVIDAFNRGDMDEVFALLDPNVRWTTADDEPDPQTYVGHEGVRQLIASLLDIWEQGFTMKAHEFIDLGDRMVMLGQLPVRGQASGVPITEKLAYVFTLKDLLVIRQEEYLDHAEALKAVGLEE